MGLRALLDNPTAILILLWLHQGLNHQPSRSQSCTLAARLQTALHTAGVQGTGTQSNTVNRVVTMN